MNIDLPLGALGLTLADLRVRLYAGAQRIPLPGGVALTATDTGVDYVLTGLPEVADVDYTVTYEYPLLVGHSRAWRGDGSRARSTPPEVIVPLREAGQGSAIAVVLLRNGVSYGAVTVAELGSPEETGDYALSGWPAALPGERWLLVWEIAGIRYFRDWRGGSVPDADLAPETVVRRLLCRYWLEAWLGPNLDERRICPARCLGFAGQETSFSAESEVDVFPWTPAEVRSSVGYALLRLRELDRFDDGLTSGAAVIDEVERIVSREYRLYALDFEFVVPSKPKGGADAVAILENRRDQVEKLFRGLALLPEGTPVLSIRQLGRYPNRPKGGYDDGTWRRAYLMVQVRARIETIHAGPQEVALP